VLHHISGWFDLAPRYVGYLGGVFSAVYVAPVAIRQTLKNLRLNVFWQAFEPLKPLLPQELVDRLQQVSALHDGRQALLYHLFRQYVGHRLP
jgi:hypothetical protein